MFLHKLHGNKRRHKCFYCKHKNSTIASVADNDLPGIY